MDDFNATILVSAVFGMLISFFLIKAAIHFGTEDMKEELKVNNALLRRQQGIHVNSIEEVRREYENGAYTLEHATNLKAKFKKEGKL